MDGAKKVVKLINHRAAGSEYLMFYGKLRGCKIGKTKTKVVSNCNI